MIILSKRLFQWRQCIRVFIVNRAWAHCMHTCCFIMHMQLHAWSQRLWRHCFIGGSLLFFPLWASHKAMQCLYNINSEGSIFKDSIKRSVFSESGACFYNKLVNRVGTHALHACCLFPAIVTCKGSVYSEISEQIGGSITISSFHSCMHAGHKGSAWLLLWRWHIFSMLISSK